MHLGAKIYVAGHRGLVGSALLRVLESRGYQNILTCGHDKLDLSDSQATEAFFAEHQPEYVFLAAAKVGGIVANNTYPAEFIRDNLSIQDNAIHCAWRHKVARLLFLGSSCIYPKLAPQPLKEAYLLTGPLEPTNRPYAVAKIAGIEMCWSYNRQYGTRFLSVMPTNLYGPGDNYHPENSHVIPGLIRKFHEAKTLGSPSVTVWGTGLPRREFMYCDEMADACVHVMNLPDQIYDTLLGSNESFSGLFEPPVINIGVGHDISIGDLASVVGEVVGYKGEVVFDPSKPDGTPQKLMDVNRLESIGWRAEVKLRDGLSRAYLDFLSRHA